MKKEETKVLEKCLLSKHTFSVLMHHSNPWNFIGYPPWDTEMMMLDDADSVAVMPFYEYDVKHKATTVY